MRKLLAIAIALVVSIGLAVPAMAIDTSVTVQGGTGLAPIIKAKWETPDDADPTHATPGTQVLAPGSYLGEKTVSIYAVVTDPEGVDTILPPAPQGALYASVWHPLAPAPEDGSLKYDQVPMSPLDLLAPYSESLAAFDSAVSQGLVAFSGIYTAAEVRHELVQNEAVVYKCDITMHYHQPWGDYRVQVEAFDNMNMLTVFENSFHYAALTMVEVDFTAVSYGSVQISINKWVGGDNVFGFGSYTVRNIGNTNAKVTVLQNDMGLGKSNGVWNVQFDARIGVGDPEVPGVSITYDPDVTATIPDVLLKCHTQKIDFSIHVIKGIAAQYSGTMTIGSVFAPFGP